ncbi:hypothetical protein [Paenibacillus radicis (ex Gao et al. 2016)]|uniref:Uncharacterized protein n=1 Tax=Paenibacillus radicis (ex Gao et al. 2016) TaxID=1737354 RepID=A0A917HK56_9BACL|nr:hypothetical protein [Paenibacillus radicis (ex Gao et al. 2016)]GGG82294.1 hypothetical protein GCM10010918_44580 [Paenibacillus radicis (ex Gao et al. 2016)]
MLKETIRSLASNGFVLGAQPQLAGVSAAEHGALQDALKNQQEKKGNYQLAFWG